MHAYRKLTDFRDEGSDFIESIDVRKLQLSGFQLIKLVQFVLKLLDHTLVAAADRGGAFAWLLLLRIGECFPKTLYLGHRSLSLCIAFDHDDIQPLTT